MKCVDCMNKYTYDHIGFEVQPCDACSEFSNFKRCQERNFLMGTDTENDEKRSPWNYLKCTVKVLNKNEFRFDLEVIGYHERDGYIKGAYKNGQLYFNHLLGQISYINNDTATKFITLSPDDIYMNYNIGKFMEIVSNEVCKNEAPSSHEICKLTMDMGVSSWEKNTKLFIKEIVYER